MARTKAMALRAAGTNSTVTTRDGPLRLTISEARARVLRIQPIPLRSVYRLGPQLGSGNFGITYRCKRKVTGEKLACKSIAKEGMTTEGLNDVMKEIQIMRRLAAKENIIQLEAVYEDDDAIHLVMERCFGGDLYHHVRKKRFCGEREAASLCRQIVEAVRTCHTAGVIHRDLRLRNVLFLTKEEDSPIQLIDFGMSLFFKEGDVFDEKSGSPQYMAPEMYTGNYGPEVDLWSAGAILYILLCGAHPFQGKSDREEATASVFEDVRFDCSPWDKISDGAKDLVTKMLERDPYMRFTADEVLSHPWILEGTKVEKRVE